ncbi:hypothetical protein ASE86_07415 [Sphingomonas sp. Leaf33]|uniref:endonuclease domain-containing protein n=1 Tax=Sphingomonas sp. Leaf33 TaxID=1736215 RepID=UPI0006F93257|nr:endonuclease domain-containing protein [Sphingomonas sp. Leaf33]KQN25993.1 hypothetical protein ASE86_07415 [Sphingomonas sp. Leaf33]
MLKDEAPKPQRGTVAKCRALRRELTLPEILLWQALRRRPAGLKFRKQHPSGPFILDFYCIDAKLVVEVDGEAHSRDDRPQRDNVRDAWFARFGLHTLRIPASSVLHDLDAVVRGIVTLARDRLPLHHPAAPGGPPPRDKLGEEW